jgi:hypothetical protein
VDLEFSITDWSAYAGRLSTQADWQAWGAQPLALVGLLGSCVGSNLPKLLEVPALLRRRFGPLARMVASVAGTVHNPLGMPVILASRYGETDRSLALLSSLVKGEDLSPTDFGLSVHNAIGALYSMAKIDHANYISVAANGSTIAAGLVEAAGLLLDGAPEVLLVCYDSPLPELYSTFADEALAMFAWSWRLACPQPGKPKFSLSAAPALSKTVGAAPTQVVALSLEVLHFFLSNQTQLSRTIDNTLWTWQRHAH